jgi:hypothetical protein
MIENSAIKILSPAGMIENSAIKILSPAGTIENSAAIYRRVKMQ